MNDQQIADLIKIYKKYSEKISIIEEEAEELGRMNDSISDLIMDLLSIPKDTSWELSESHGAPECFEHPDYFCRDGFYEILFSDDSPQEILKGLKNELKELKI